MAIFSTLITKVGLPYLVDLVGDSLKKSDNKAIKKAGEDLANTLNEVERDEVQKTSLDQGRLQELELRLDGQKFSEINQTYRLEVASNDGYVRRMRPTFGYIMALTWAAQMLAIAYMIVVMPEAASDVIHAFGALSMIWSVGLSVLGVYVYKRSQEKTLKADEGDLLKKVGALFK